MLDRFPARLVAAFLAIPLAQALVELPSCVL